MEIKCVESGAWLRSVERVDRLMTAVKSDSFHEFESCCKKRLMKSIAFRDPPSSLQNLLFDNGSRGVALRKNIRQYVAALTFMSLGYKKYDRPENQTNRELYHIRDLLLPGSLESAQYAQRFFYDPAYATELRHRRNQNLDISGDSARIDGHGLVGGFSEVLYYIYINDRWSRRKMSENAKTRQLIIYVLESRLISTPRIQATSRLSWESGGICHQVPWMER